MYCLLLWLLFVDSLCDSNENHCKLQRKFDLSKISKQGDVILGGIFNIHTAPLEHINYFLIAPEETKSFRLANTMMFAIEEINQDPVLLPGIFLGYKIYDDCDSPNIAIKAALDLVNGQEQEDGGPTCEESPNVPALVGATGSSESMAVAKTIGPFRIPVVKNNGLNAQSDKCQKILIAI
uniref:Receptor ligand binding region domain-containing protein n=1 Tax=Callorhinchus milii TaxID=7868 RepID=A0A4W3GBQ0_CALMI